MLNGKPIVDGELLNININKVVCVGRNYALHAKELNNPIPDDTPLLFIKPNSTLCKFSDKLAIPDHLGLVHHELEISVLVGKPLSSESTLDEIKNSLLGVGLALDLTIRDLQFQLKEKGHPWERAKCFPNACPISQFIGINKIDRLENLKIQLTKNGKIQQQGSANQMIFPIIDLVKQAAKAFTLSSGDIILTGTPSGVSSLSHGDTLEAELTTHQPLIKTHCQVIRQ